jgi:hypothetical protein
MIDAVFDTQPLSSKVAWFLAPILSYGKLVLEPIILAERRDSASAAGTNCNPGT